MSSFIKKLKHPKTKKKQLALCIDDYFGSHRYGYFFRKDGKPATWDDFDKLQRVEDNFDIFNEDEIEQDKFSDFIEYHKAHPKERFWQALRNWSGYNFIYGSMVNLEDGLDKLIGLKDTFYD